MRFPLIKGCIAAVLLLFVQMAEALAQCAMCRATVENNLNTGETTVGAGLNYGIMYLFAAPYVLALIIGYFWYKHSKKQKMLRRNFNIPR